MRRLFWLGVGAAAGASGTVWAQRRVRERLEALEPDQLVVVAGRAAGKGARAVGRTVVAAVGEGRAAMAEREVELRDRLQGPGHRPGVDLRSVPDRRGPDHAGPRHVPARRASPVRHRTR